MILYKHIYIYTVHGLHSGVTQVGHASTLYDPTLFLNMVRVDPTMDRELRNSAKSIKDGLI